MKKVIRLTHSGDQVLSDSLIRIGGVDNFHQLIQTGLGIRHTETSDGVLVGERMLSAPVVIEDITHELDFSEGEQPDIIERFHYEYIISN
jgi:hypothetical protein